MLAKCCHSNLLIQTQVCNRTFYDSSARYPGPKYIRDTSARGERKMSKKSLKKALLASLEGMKKDLEELGSDNDSDAEEDGLDSPRVERRSATSGHASNSHSLQFTPSSASYAEQQRLFGPRRTSSGRKGKGKKRSHDGAIGQRTWTRKFVCLRNQSDFSAPKAAEKAVLMGMNLGERRLTFGVKSTATDVDKTLKEAYPALALVGGYTLLVTDVQHGNRNLIPLKPPYDVASLKSQSESQNIYIRPLQESIPRKHVGLPEEDNKKVIELTMPSASQKLYGFLFTEGSGRRHLSQVPCKTSNGRTDRTCWKLFKV